MPTVFCLQVEYKKRLAEGLGTENAPRILAFKNKVCTEKIKVVLLYSLMYPSQLTVTCHLQAPAPPEGMQNSLAALYSQNAVQRPAKKNFRNIPQAPERILDAPELLDDYYLNLLDWGPMNNVVRLFCYSQASDSDATYNQGSCVKGTALDGTF